ncbi:MAG: carboxypeptidase regulatory-like domain-containing protein [Methylococcales bacterium]|nr:carboxypeptidase regulatory-like domain-containing protein [Methylococcales bacterium]MDD5631618.1 carboxypeptidase regulatory-like domain-containing protein [Methylococcales bacterium]
MKKLCLALILPCVLFSLSSIAEESAIQPQTQGKVTFVTGGVGIDERNALDASRANYNLSLLFSVKGTGDYLSDVKIRITDLKGNVFLETVSDGPKLFAKLPPGRYIVIVDLNGETYRKTVSVRGKHNTSLYFTWSQKTENEN